MSRPKFKPMAYQFKKGNFFNVKISTNTNNELTNIAFLRAKTTITPLIEKKTYETDIILLKSDFMAFARKLLDNVTDFDKNYIFTVDVAEKSVRFNKTSHLHYDLFVKTKNHQTLEEHKNKLLSISDKLEEKLIMLFKKCNLKWK